MTNLLVGAGQIGALLLHDPLLFADVELSCELAIVLANNALNWVVETVSDVVRALRNFLRLSTGVVCDQSLAVRAQIVCGHFSVEATILESGVIPVLVFEFELVKEEVSARDQLASVPLCNVPTLLNVSFSFSN